MRSRCFLRLGRNAESLAELEQIEIDALVPADLAETLALLAFTKLLSRDQGGTLELLLLARVKAIEAGYADVLADVEFACALWHLTIGEHEEAEKAARHVLEVAETDEEHGAELLRSSALSLADIRLRAYDLLAHLAFCQGRNDDKLSLLRTGLEGIRDASSSDHYVEAKVLAHYAYHGAEVDAAGVHEFVLDRLNRMIFSDFTRKFEFEIHRTTGLGFAVRGDHLGALRELRFSAKIAPSSAYRIKALSDRSLLARELGEYLSADDEAAYALELAEPLDWHAVAPEDAEALLHLSVALAPCLGTEARRLLDLYRACKRNSAFDAVRGDVGTTAHEYHVDARVSLVEGDVDRAIRSSREAFELYKSIDYRWRAADVAANLFELTGSPEYLEYAQLRATAYPQSHLARRVRAYREGQLRSA